MLGNGFDIEDRMIVADIVDQPNFPLPVGPVITSSLRYSLNRLIVLIKNDLAPL